jgi:hypothetical protein
MVPVDVGSGCQARPWPICREGVNFQMAKIQRRQIGGCFIYLSFAPSDNYCSRMSILGGWILFSSIFIGKSLFAFEFKVPSGQIRSSWEWYHWIGPESIATLPPFGHIEGQKWFDQISSQWESQKNRFAFISFGKNQFLPPYFWNRPFMSYRLRIGR